MRKLLAALAALVCLTSAFAGSFSIIQVGNSSGAGATQGWNILPIGAGGNLDGMSIANDSTMVVRTDTYGAYLWCPATSTPVGCSSSTSPVGTSGTWQQLVTSSSLPAGLANQTFGLYNSGVQELVLAPTNSSKMYMLYVVAGSPYPYQMGLFYSTNQGVNWNLSNGFPATISSGTYNSSTGAVSLTLASPGINFVTGSPIVISGLTGTGSVASLNGTYASTAAATGSGGNQVTTVTYTAATGLGSITITGGTLTASVSANTGNGGYVDGTFKGWGQKMAVDPTNANNVLIGTPQNGLFYSTDGGVTLSLVTGVPAGLKDVGTGTYPGITGIAYSPASATTIYASSYGNGVYQTTTGPAGTWTKLTNGTGPGNVRLGAVDGGTGFYWAVDAAGNLWYWDGTIWHETLLASSTAVNAFAIDPNTSGHVIAGGNSGNLNETTNNGAPSWSGWTSSAPFSSTGDVTWLHNVFGSIGQPNAMAIDPNVGAATTRKVYAATNLDLYSVTMSGAPPSGGSTQTWQSQGRGIEQLVGNRVIVPDASGANPLVAGWDSNTYYSSSRSAYPTTNGQQVFAAAWNVDYVAGSNPPFITAFEDGNYAVAGEHHAFSSDGGQTWTAFSGPSTYTNTHGGAIAASSSTNWLISAFGSQPYYTTNGGASPTWNAITIGGVASWSSMGGSGNNQGSSWIVADRVNAGQFTMMISGTGFATSINSGASWTLSTTGTNASAGGSGQIKSVPGQANHIFWATGGSGTGSIFTGGNPLYYTTNSQAAPISWTQITNVKGPLCVGFGKAANGQTYPAVYTVGWVESASSSTVSVQTGAANFTLTGATGNSYTVGSPVSLFSGAGTMVGHVTSWNGTVLGVNVDSVSSGSGSSSGWTAAVYGIFAALTGMPTASPAWTQVGSGFPVGSMDNINDCTGDMNNYGYAYIANAGSGWKYYHP